jgi:exodeoxyribonuclease V alpha subunit
MIAQKLGFAKGDLARVKAGILFGISTVINVGHLYCEVEQLKKTTLELLELEQTDEKTVKHALHELYNHGSIKLISYPSATDEHAKHYVTLAKYYFSEKGLATRLLTLIERPPVVHFDVNAIYNQLREAEAASERGISLNEEQQQGILTALQHKVTVITGGPGTGKTTLIKKLLDILDAHRMNYKLAAPTGRAAKRMMEGTGRFAVTLHRLLEFDFATMGFVHNEQNALKLNFLIIDEASMIDIFLAHAIAKALPLDAHVIFIGDVDQLPSVGAGNFLNDLIESKKTATIQLKHIFRQAADSLIVVNAHRVNAGEFPTSYVAGSKRDFVFIKEADATLVQDHLKNIYTQLLQRAHIKAEDAIVLVPMHRGVVGTQKLNNDLQQLLNPQDTVFLERSGNKFKVNDRVMQIKNNYDKNVFNGDVGIIGQIDHDNRIIHVTYDGRTVEYEFEELDELVLAYAISIHKSQGSEYPAVIIPIFMQHFTLLARNLIYTAITRAKKLCILIGQPRAIAMAIKNTKGLERITFFKQFLTTDLQCR